jgi:hypothetical protein
VSGRAVPPVGVVGGFVGREEQPSRHRVCSRLGYTAKKTEYSETIGHKVLHPCCGRKGLTDLAFKGHILLQCR